MDRSDWAGSGRQRDGEKRVRGGAGRGGERRSRAFSCLRWDFSSLGEVAGDFAERKRERKVVEIVLTGCLIPPGIPEAGISPKAKAMQRGLEGKLQPPQDGAGSVRWYYGSCLLCAPWVRFSVLVLVLQIKENTN